MSEQVKRKCETADLPPAKRPCVKQEGGVDTRTYVVVIGCKSWGSPRWRAKITQSQLTEIRAIFPYSKGIVSNGSEVGLRFLRVHQRSPGFLVNTCPNTDPGNLLGKILEGCKFERVNPKVVLPHPAATFVIAEGKAYVEQSSRPTGHHVVAGVHSMAHGFSLYWLPIPTDKFQLAQGIEDNMYASLAEISAALGVRDSWAPVDMSIDRNVHTAGRAAYFLISN